MMKRIPLPIDPILPGVVERLEISPNLVLKAAPGSGKTTRVPPELLRSRFCGDSEIWVLEPRRLAAKYSARRVAQEMGETVGSTVGYQVRFENVSGPSTRLRFLTEGMLMRRLLHDRSLSRVAAVILDEFHERHLHTDTALAYLRHLQATERPDLRLVVMSATLETEPIAAYLGGAPVLEARSSPHPVRIEHLSGAGGRPLEALIRDATFRALNDSGASQGDILVFLPGMAEIRRAEESLDQAFEGGRDRPLVFPLHGELSREEQDRAIQKAERRKVILATNVAETSLTIEGVTVVIDSGLHRAATYSWWSGVPALRTKAISRASAAQRAGRAGRTAPGLCLRLYSQGDFDSRPPFETPEIRRADLSQILLELKAIGLRDLQSWKWFEAPAQTSLEASWNLLYRLGALERPSIDAALTSLGRQMAAIPAHPRLARMLIEAKRRSVLDPAASLASLVSEGRLERLDALEAIANFASGGETLRRSKSHLISALRELAVEATPAPAWPEDERLRFAVLTGFPDRVAKKRKPPSQASRGQSTETELLFSSGGAARVDDAGPVREGEYFVVLDLRETQRLGQSRAQTKVLSLSPIRPEWLFDLQPGVLREQNERVWNAERERVMQRSQLLYDGLVLDETLEPAPADAATVKVLMRRALGLDPERLAQLPPHEWSAALGQLAEAGSIESALAKALLLQKHFPSLVRPAAQAWERLELSLADQGSVRDLREMDWPAEIMAAFIAEPALGRIPQWFPDAILLPGGRRAKIRYALDKAPWVESRLQDFFGMKKAPSLLDGRVPLILHLLAPNQRAVQVTTDLAGFWEREYPELRRMLSRRYPKHAWPEDPLQASPRGFRAD